LILYLEILYDHYELNSLTLLLLDFLYTQPNHLLFTEALFLTF
jgi:hypothetical protein